MRKLTITLDVEIYKRLIEYLISRHGPVEAGRKRSEIIREALAQYLEKKERKA